VSAVAEAIQSALSQHRIIKDGHPFVDATPAGLHVGREVKIDYVQQANIDAMPTLAIESAISEHEWVSKGGADRNTLIDKFHLISALPYVDEIVSDDKFFHELYPVAVKTGHVKAKLLGNAEFLNRF
jgi:hypothetical protein